MGKTNKQIVECLKKMKPEVAYTLDDKGNGELFADIFKEDCRYNVTAKQWFYYDGKIWREDTEAMTASRKAKELTDALDLYSGSISNVKEREYYQRYIAKIGQLRVRNNMLADARDKFCISADDIDKDFYTFNCKNGTLNLRTFEFREHGPEDLLSKISNVIYDPDAKSHRWHQFIDDVMCGDEDKSEYLQKALGYALTGDTKCETCFICYGATTRNGKSTLLETIGHMMGGTAGYAMTMNPESLAQKKNPDPRQASGDIARLKGCRLLTASEPSKRMVFDVAFMKTLLGRDSITARHLHQRELEFVPVFKLFINTNYLPVIGDSTLFSSGRLNVITFDRHFSPAEQDKSLKDKLKEASEISGIFNWCLEGLKKYYAEGLEPPPSVLNATEEYRRNSDKIEIFISDCLEKSGMNSKAKDVYERYKDWCDAKGYGLEGKSGFFAELKSKGIFANSGTVNGKTVANVVKGYKLVPHCGQISA